MSIDYALAKRLVTKHKSALTRARKVGPQAVLDACTTFYAEMVTNDLPLPDDWHVWDVAAAEARHELLRGRP